MRQTPVFSETDRETLARPTSLKALARKALARDVERDGSETAPPETVRQMRDEKPGFVSLNFHGLRARMLVTAEAEGINPAAFHNLTDAELQAHAAHIASFPADQQADVIRALLSMLDTTTSMRGGRLPASFDTPALCSRCGPVWLPASQVTLLDVVDGWPRAYGCPWCFVHLTQGLRIPRPRVTCAACRHYQPDAINPDGGMGSCGIDANQGGTTWPHEERTCRAFKPKEPTP